jgi:hypothetical protein
MGSSPDRSSDPRALGQPSTSSIGNASTVCGHPAPKVLGQPRNAISRTSAVQVRPARPTQSLPDPAGHNPVRDATLPATLATRTAYTAVPAPGTIGARTPATAPTVWCTLNAAWHRVAMSGAHTIIQTGQANMTRPTVAAVPSLSRISLPSNRAGVFDRSGRRRR